MNDILSNENYACVTFRDCESDKEIRLNIRRSLLDKYTDNYLTINNPQVELSHLPSSQYGHPDSSILFGRVAPDIIKYENELYYSTIFKIRHRGYLEDQRVIIEHAMLYRKYYVFNIDPYNENIENVTTDNFFKIYYESVSEVIDNWVKKVEDTGGG